MPTKKRRIEILEREIFLDTYSEFNNWIAAHGFRRGHYWKESATPLDCCYSHYRDYIDPLHGVEHYVHDVLNISIRFIRSRHKHKFMLTGDLGTHSKLFNLSDFKSLISNVVSSTKREKLAALMAI